MCSAVPVIGICSLLTRSFFSSLFDVVTDENSESESDTEEKLKGKKRNVY